MKSSKVRFCFMSNQVMVRRNGVLLPVASEVGDAARQFNQTGRACMGRVAYVDIPRPVSGSPDWIGGLK